LRVNHLNTLLFIEVPVAVPVKRIYLGLSNPTTPGLERTPCFNDVSDLLDIGPTFFGSRQSMRINAYLQLRFVPPDLRSLVTNGPAMHLANGPAGVMPYDMTFGP
jgi:hypothetical protein